LETGHVVTLNPRPDGTLIFPFDTAIFPVTLFAR